ncbi:MIZ-type zinc finger transcription factor [Phycomyces blakesleeanus NRRL 1555(-)]|uniref:MIZ-type zinc finger transcription factor n=1 Tax=Phycomyces blakesleeanus (strain ATCC 8743b / DSM 1359 / FGSC 10004 / NBRC 33097 / NRRL 1555) TaxID=763407 RepID=A0A162V110_PHYB8|nr:MIZ-type zinc finger transcription factor [Phycomyces blakesleeanus NRRL 1555(-)]OAD79273.1 MIZ-type zinc finger transcription factor [Phycomyces blakesleeanus NRRL 1555(-)]|eukprot:XP_018297313.1 MIZ-type zinc finger transcription factor [Phycomyces blakesleeanus NRRL 1555(-)]
MVESNTLLYDTLGSLRVPDLKSIINMVNDKFNHTISTKGRKDEIVLRLSEHLPELVEKCDKAEAKYVIDFMNTAANKKLAWTYSQGSFKLLEDTTPEEQERVAEEDTLTQPTLPQSVPNSADGPWPKRRRLQDQDQSQQLNERESQLQFNQAQLLHETQQNDLTRQHHLLQEQSQQQPNPNQLAEYMIKTPQVSMSDPNNMHQSSTSQGFPSQYRTDNPMLINTKPNSFYRRISTLTHTVSCPVTPENGRGSKHLNFKLSLQQVEKLKLPRPYDGRSIFQVRMFCIAAPDPDQTDPTAESLIEFPPMCELRINGHIIEGSSLRGLKNKPGTVHAPDVTPWIKPFHLNKVELLFANTTKRYLACMEFVERSTVNALVEDLTVNFTMSKETVLENFKNTNSDTDIVITYATLTTRCPIGFSRIGIPCRSIACQHLQCYDLTTFLSMNEQTPTWKCPVCSCSISSHRELFIDGHFSDILSRVGKRIESIQIDSNGEMKEGSGGGNSSEDDGEDCADYDSDDNPITSASPQTNLRKENNPANPSPAILCIDSDSDNDNDNNKGKGKDNIKVKDNDKSECECECQSKSKSKSKENEDVNRNDKEKEKGDDVKAQPKPLKSNPSCSSAGSHVTSNYNHQDQKSRSLRRTEKNKNRPLVIDLTTDSEEEDDEDKKVIVKT